MRIFGHPVHVMLVHFPVALWPAHECVHLFASQLPLGAGTVGFWLLCGGTLLGWLAASLGMSDLVELWRENDRPRSSNGLIHAALNGTALIGFSVIAVAEYRTFPSIVHGTGFLIGETALLLALFIGNYFGGAVIWTRLEKIRK